MSAHTPTPWDVNGETIIGYDGENVAAACYGGSDEDDERFCVDAAFIVRCVNAHDAYVELEQAVRAMRYRARSYGPGELQAAQARVDAALAKLVAA